jgi:uncharacterized protein YjiS (DUF1127 family)
MTTTTLRLHRPAPLRLFDDARDGFARWRRERESRLALQSLDRHLLRDIGVDAGLIETLDAQSHARDLAMRLRACGSS